MVKSEFVVKVVKVIVHSFYQASSLLLECIYGSKTHTLMDESILYLACDMVVVRTSIVDLITCLGLHIENALIKVVTMNFGITKINS